MKGQVGIALLMKGATGQRSAGLQDWTCIGPNHRVVFRVTGT